MNLYKVIFWLRVYDVASFKIPLKWVTNITDRTNPPKPTNVDFEKVKAHLLVQRDLTNGIMVEDKSKRPTQEELLQFARIVSYLET